MDRPGLENTAREPSRVIYTCWPFGGLLCGLATMGIGALLLADHYLDAAPEMLWGVGLIMLGAVVIFASQDRDGWR